jgi:hypothetical protein
MARPGWNVGGILVRDIPPVVKRKLLAMASQRRTSLNQLCLEIFVRAVGGHEEAVGELDDPASVIARGGWPTAKKATAKPTKPDGVSA